MINIIDFGKDHWSLLAYVETRCVDYKGILDKKHLRIKNEIDKSGSDYYFSQTEWKPEYGTRLFGYFKEDGTKDKHRQLKNHDDLDCLEDLEDAGLIENIGTGLHPAVKLRKLGIAVTSQLREHKTNGGTFATFIPVI
jgi:hypothetical protein